MKVLLLAILVMWKFKKKIVEVIMFKLWVRRFKMIPL